MDSFSFHQEIKYTQNAKRAIGQEQNFQISQWQLKQNMLSLSSDAGLHHATAQHPTCQLPCWIPLSTIK